MIVFAAVDLQQGEVVQLVGGRRDSARVRLPNPVEVAQQWEQAGFRELHVIDLDAARGEGDNRRLVRDIVRSVSVPVQVGGGVRGVVAIESLLELGAARVITGTRAIEDEDWLHMAAAQFPEKLVVAADVKDGIVLTRGWTATTKLTLADALDRLNRHPLAAVLITDVGREGQMTGVDQQLFQDAAKRSVHPLYAAGGIASAADLAALEAAGAAGAVLGMALYTGAIDGTELRPN